MSDEASYAVSIYPDPCDRGLIDTAIAECQPHEWHPMNGSASRLFKCREALQDIQEILEAVEETQDIAKIRRRLRAIFVPMHSFCVGLIDLMNQIQSEQEIHSRLPVDAVKIINDLRTRFVRLVPYDRAGKLGKLRNRLSAHYEKSMAPHEMRELYSQTTFTEIGGWLHISLSVLCDLLKLDAYAWEADGPEPDTIITMWQEPIICVLRLQDHVVIGIENSYLRKVSPKLMVFSHVEKVAALSQFLFEVPSVFRISGFYSDTKVVWANTLSATKGLVP
jgi:hypothetical protein